MLSLCPLNEDCPSGCNACTFLLGTALQLVCLFSNLKILMCPLSNMKIKNCRTVTVGSQIYLSGTNVIRILQVSWHPCSDTHLGILSSDSVFRYQVLFYSYIVRIVLFLLFLFFV